MIKRAIPIMCALLACLLLTGCGGGKAAPAADAASAPAAGAETPVVRFAASLGSGALPPCRDAAREIRAAKNGITPLRGGHAPLHGISPSPCG